MKIAIFPGYGSNNIPDFLIDAVNRQERNYRIVLAEEIEKLSDTHEEITDELFVAFRDGKLDIPYIKANDHIYFMSSAGYTEMIDEIALVDIDKDKPWRINDYDGAEGIEYFNGIKVVDEDTGECEW